MKNKFQHIWEQMIGLCVTNVPWEAIVDFRARVWPALNVSQRPEGMGAAEYTRLSDEQYTEMAVILGSRKVEIAFFPSAEIFHSRGYTAQRLDWVETMQWSPSSNGGCVVRGTEHFERLAKEALNWLTHGKGVEYGRSEGGNSVCVAMASTNGQAAGRGLPVS